MEDILAMDLIHQGPYNRNRFLMPALRTFESLVSCFFFSQIPNLDPDTTLWINADAKSNLKKKHKVQGRFLEIQLLLLMKNCCRYELHIHHFPYKCNSWVQSNTDLPRLEDT